MVRTLVDFAKSFGCQLKPIQGSNQESFGIRWAFLAVDYEYGT